MTNCIFCEIGQSSERELYRVIYEDELFVAILVNKPESRGHFIVFPRIHFTNLDEYDDRNTLFNKTVSLAEVFVQKIGTTSYTLKLNNKVYEIDDDPRHVGHIHMHVIPRYKDATRLNEPVTVSRKYFEEVKSLMTGNKN